MKAKKIIMISTLAIILIAIIILFINISKNQNSENGKVKVVVSNFASYDFLRAIIGDTDNVELIYLLGAGKSSHSYDPTAQDIIKIQEADLFVYIGGEAESWSEKILDALDESDVKIICIADNVEKIKEQEIDGAEHEEDDEAEGAFDEHIWTSPSNAIAMVNLLEKEIEELDNENIEKYKENAEKYIEQIKMVDKQIQEIVDDKVRNRLVFGDKMPMQYFISYYGLDVSAAFSGCSTETDPSASTIAYLVNVVKKEKIPVVLYIEMGNEKVANIIADEVGGDCIAMQIQTLHNVSKEDFENGETWVTLMQRNLKVLKNALQ